MSLYGNNSRIMNRYSNMLRKWYIRREDKFINLICEPYQNLEFVYELVKDCLKNGEKVLYVGKSKKVCRVDVVNSINFYFSSFENIFRIKEKFDLIIFDDVSLYSNKNILECNEDLIYLKNLCEKIIICSVDKIFNNIEHKEVLNKNRKVHFLEPRLITTRVNLEKAMPYILYEYIEWFIREKRVLVIYVPKEINKEYVYDYYTKDLKLEDKVRILKGDKNTSLLKIMEESKYRKEGIIYITDSLHDYFDYNPNCDLIIYFFNKESINYKKIIFACGSLGKNKCQNREVILLSNYENEQIEIARRLARSFNETLWRDIEEE